MLADWQTRMLRPFSEVVEFDASLGIFPTYMDPVLRRQRRTCVRLVKSFLQRGMVRLSKTCRCQVGVFTVGRKNGDLRLILECCRSSRRFLEAPGVEALTAEGWSSIEVESLGEGLTDGFARGIADIEYCFQRSKFGEDGLGPKLAEHFGMPLILAEELGITTLNGEAMS